MVIESLPLRHAEARTAGWAFNEAGNTGAIGKRFTSVRKVTGSYISVCVSRSPFLNRFHAADSSPGQ